MPLLQLPPGLPVLDRPPVALRAFRDADAELVVSAGADPLIPLLETVPAGATAEQARQWIAEQNRALAEGAGCSFAIADASTRRAIGHIGLWPRPGRRAAITYWIAPEHRGKGWAAAALTVLTDWALWGLRAQRLEILVEPDNDAGWRTAETVGFRPEGLLRSWREIGGVRRDTAVYSRLPQDRKRPAPRH